MTQAVPYPNGVTTFGSCVVHIEPDFATINVGVSRRSAKLEEASAQVRGVAATLKGYFPRAGVESTRASRLHIETVSAPDGTVKEFVVSTHFNLTVREIERLESIISGAMSAGANVFNGITMRSSRLREARAEARQGAFLASLKRAEQYAEAAGIKLGRVIHVEEVPDEELDAKLDELDEFDTSGAYSQTSIAVRAAVRVAFSIKAGKMVAATGTFPTFDP
jgi:uncharacterized protein YggE